MNLFKLFAKRRDAETAHVAVDGEYETLITDAAGRLKVNPMVEPTTSAYNSAATTNATSVKASAGRVLAVAVSNVGAAARYLKLYNKATAPVVGTDVPVLTVAVPATGVVTLNVGALGLHLANGIAFALTAGAADADIAAVAAAEVKVVLSYI
jgi:hypothetical protein